MVRSASFPRKKKLHTALPIALHALAATWPMRNRLSGLLEL
jgi:hypothetical protein